MFKKLWKKIKPYIAPPKWLLGFKRNHPIKFWLIMGVLIIIPMTPVIFLSLNFFTWLWTALFLR